MSVEWGDYEVFDPGVNAPLNELPKSEARAAFGRLMEARHDRIDALKRLLQRNGVELGTSDDAVQDLNDWFRVEIDADPSNPSRLRPIWYSVVNDLALFLGELIIQRAPNVRWVLFERNAKSASFQRHVLMGFTRVENPEYNVDIDLLLATYAHEIISNHEVETEAFWRWVKAAHSYA